MSTTIAQLEAQAEQKYGLPSGVLGSIRQQETGGRQEFLDDPTKAHYPTGYTKTGVKSSAFGPYGILESTGKQPGYGTAPLANKTLEEQVRFAAEYLTGRAKHAGSLEAGLAGYGEGAKYSASVMKRIGGNSTMNSPVQVPAAKNDFDTMAAQAMDNNDATANALLAFQKESQNIYQSAQSVLENQGANAQLVKTTELMATAQAQSNSLEAARSLGTDPNSANFILDEVAKQFKTNSDRAQKFADKVAFVSDPSNILKDPLSYLGNAILYDVNVAAQASAERAAARSKEQYIGLNNMTQEFAQTQSAIKQSVTAETALAAGQMAKADLDFNVMKLQLDAVRSNSDTVVKVAQLQNNKLDFALKARDQQLQEINIANAKTNADLQRESLRLSLEERSDRIAAKKETLEDQENYLRLVNAGRQLSGLTPFPSHKEMVLQASMNPKIKEAIFHQYQQGMIAGQTGVATVADNPYDALKYVRMTGAKITDGRAGVINMISDTEAEIRKNPKVDLSKMKEPEYAKLVTEGVKTRATSMLSNISTGGKNIYSAPAISVFTEDATMQGTHLVENILRPADQLGTEQLNFKSIAAKMVQDMKEGKINYEQAQSELVFLGEKIKGYNNATYRYNETAGLPVMSQVNVALDDSSSFTNFVNRTAPYVENSSSTGGLLTGLFGGETETIIDLSNPTKVGAYLNKQMAKTIPAVIREQAAKNGAK